MGKQLEVDKWNKNILLFNGFEELYAFEDFNISILLPNDYIDLAFSNTSY